MTQGGKGKKMMSLLEKKEAANTARTAMRREAEELSSMMARMESMDNHELREYMSQIEGTLESQMITTFMKLMPKDKPKKKKRNTLCPILGATLKFHKDDDTDPAAAGAVESVA